MSEPRIHGRSVSTKRRWEVLKRFGFKCVYCGRSAEERSLDVDHVIPIARGGSNDDHNLVAACVECNMGKGIDMLVKLPNHIKVVWQLSDPHFDAANYANHEAGTMIAGRLFRPPWEPEINRYINSVALHVSVLGEAACWDKADALHNNDALDNRARYEQFNQWACDLICPDDEDEEDDDGEIQHLRLTEDGND